MKRTVRFRLNGTLREERVDEASVALDWLRNSAGLKGTKEGCREGDCGACLVLLGGRAYDGSAEWRSVTSCTLAMGELDGGALITIEGLAADGLTPVMDAMLDEGASQCGFCSPGFVLALTGFLLSGRRVDAADAMLSVEGNLCRCTGYGSIRRAAARLAAEYADLPGQLDPAHGGAAEGEAFAEAATALAARIAALAERGVIPSGLAATMLDMPEPIGRPEPGSAPAAATGSGRGAALALGGGTDWFVRNPDPEPGLDAAFMSLSPDARRIEAVERGGERWLSLGPGLSAADFFGSPLARDAVPGIGRFERDVASPPIRNRATLAGNVANASPIADMSAMLIGLGAVLALGGPGGRRELPVEDFFVAYKKTALRPGEAIAAILIPASWSRFGFEKAAKRARLDIATVNCAMAVRLGPDGSISSARYSVGGVAPVPLRLREVEALVRGRAPSAELAREAGALASRAGGPLSDVRGSSEYRKRLLTRLAWALFIRLWPELKLEEELLR